MMSAILHSSKIHREYVSTNRSDSNNSLVSKLHYLYTFIEYVSNNSLVAMYIKNRKPAFIYWLEFQDKIYHFSIYHTIVYIKE